MRQSAVLLPICLRPRRRKLRLRICRDLENSLKHMHEEKLSKILYALEIDAESSIEQRAVMRRRGGMSHINKDELAKKWKARMKTAKHRKRAEAIYAQYEATLDVIAAGNAPVKVSPVQPTPSLLRKAARLAKAIGAETKAKIQGHPKLTKEQVAARLAVCGSCDQLRSNRTCAKCGCFVDAKARFISQGCPLRKWPKM